MTCFLENNSGKPLNFPSSRSHITQQSISKKPDSLDKSYLAFFLDHEERSEYMFNEERTNLLRDNDTAGLFSEVYSEEKAYWLEMWQLPTLLDYHRAVLAFLSYFQVSSNRDVRIHSASTNSTEPRLTLNASIGTRILA